tara:strand:+ start:1710 stop:2126 length:417 start_codon:yes stop_codon:yes gene_type:complete
MLLKDISLNTLANTGVLRQVELSTDLAKIYCQTKNRKEAYRDWDQEIRDHNADLGNKILALENKELEKDINIYGVPFDNNFWKKPSETIPATVWSEDNNYGEPGYWLIYFYHDPNNGSTRVTAEKRDGNGWIYLVKID